MAKALPALHKPFESEVKIEVRILERFQIQRDLREYIRELLFFQRAQQNVEELYNQAGDEIWNCRKAS